MVLESLDKRTSYVRGRRITPNAPCIRQATLLIDYFSRSCLYLLVLPKVQGRSPFVRKSLSYRIKF